MSAPISEILKITVPTGFSLGSPQFANLRQSLARGGIKEQYYGISTDEPNDLFWVIYWPGDAELALDNSDFRKSLKDLDADSCPNSWSVPFRDVELLRLALTAPLCEIATITLKSATKTPALADSLHKTFTDCYHAKGFVGGSWGIANNDKKMNWYFIGWDTRESHDSYEKTELFDVEINKIKPYMAGGQARYIKFAREISS